MTILRQFTWALLATGALTLTACSEQAVAPSDAVAGGDLLAAKGGKPPSGDPPATWTPAQDILYKSTVTASGKTRYQIVVTSPGTADEAIVLSGETEVIDPAWSSSGNAIYFNVLYGFQGRGIYAVTRDPATNGVSAPELQFTHVRGGMPAMSPDGSRLAYVEFGVEPGDIWVRERAPDGSWGSPINIDGNGSSVTGAFPAWASDSRRLVATNDRDLVVYDIDPDGNGMIDEISATSITAGGPLEGQFMGGQSSWARNDDRVVFGNTPGLWLIDFNNPANVKTCLLAANGSTDPKWSPDDTQLVHGGYPGDIRVMTLGPPQSNGCPSVASEHVIAANSSKCSGRSCERVREPDWRRF